MKLCADKQCPRAGLKLSASEFPRNKCRKDGQNAYCRTCSIRHVKEYRAKRKIIRKAQKEARLKMQTEVARKPSITAAERVRRAVERGAKDIESIQRATEFDYDFLGDILVEMGKLI